MRIDVTLLGISGNSLRWLRRLAPWSIVPLILGALVLATVALGSVRYNGEAYHHAWGEHQGMIGVAQAEPLKIFEQQMPPQKLLNVPVSRGIIVVYEQGWSPIKVRGSAVQKTGSMFIAAHPGKAVLIAHQGANTWKYTITVVGPH